MILLQVDKENHGTCFWAHMDEAFPDLFEDWREWEIVSPETWARIRALPGFADGPTYAREALKATPLPRWWTRYSELGFAVADVEVEFADGFLVAGRKYAINEFLDAEPDLLGHGTGWYLVPCKRQSGPAGLRSCVLQAGGAVRIRNINERFGDPVEFGGATLEEAVAEMQATIRTCGPEFADVVVTPDDYVTVGSDE